MSESVNKAVFLSYASQDKEVAAKICEALRAAGLEVWFDQSELRGGDAWDQKIRRQIKECALFMPVISPNTNARAEGYFRLEWKLAVDRSHLLADDHPFLFPIVVGEVNDATARVPDKFRDVQWTRLRLDETPGELAARVMRLLSGDVAGVADPGPGSPSPATGRRRSVKSGFERWWWLIFPIMGMAVPIISVLKKSAQPERPAAVSSPDPRSQTPDPKPPTEAQKLTAQARALALHDQLDEVTREDFALAEQLLKRAVESDPLDAEAWAAYAQCACGKLSLQYDSSQTNREQAHSRAERAIKLAPESNEARFAWAWSYRFQQSNNRDEVVRLHRELAERMPTDKRVLRLTGRAIDSISGTISVSDSAEARATAQTYYVRAAALPGGDAIALRLLADSLFADGRVAEAGQAMDQAIALRPLAGHLYTSRINQLISRGADLAAAQAVLPRIPPAYLLDDQGAYVACWVWLWSRQPEQCLAVLRGLNHDYIDARYFVGPKTALTGQAHEMAGRHAAALAEWQVALQKTEQRIAADPGATLWLAWRAELLARLGRKEAAENALQTFEQLARAPRGQEAGLAQSARILLGQHDRVLAGLEQGVANLSSRWRLAGLRWDPMFDPLRDNPRFQKLLQQAEATVAGSTAAKPIAPTAPLSEAQRAVARALQLRALNGLTRERLGAAEELLAQALKADPSDAALWAVAAQVDALMADRGWDNTEARRQSAAKRVSRALALAPEATEVRHAQAVVAGFMVGTAEGRAEAESLYRALLRERPDDPDLLEEFGTLLRGLRRYDEAAEVLARTGRQVLVGRVYYAANKYDEARKIIDALLAEKRTPEVLILKADLELFGFNDPEAARAAVSRLTPTELREDDAAAIALRLALLSRDGPGILKLLDSFPHPFVSVGVNYPRQYWTGVARELMKQPEAAEIEWRGALQSVEERLKTVANEPEMLSWAAALRARLKDREGAERTLRLYGNYRDLSTGQWDWMYCLTLLQLGGRNEEVIDRLEKTLRDPARWGRILYAWVRFSPELDPVRGNPRFEKLLRDTMRKGARPFEDQLSAISGQPSASDPRSQTPDPGPSHPAQPDAKSVAVLAFANLSDDKANEYFSDGISEELLNVLAKVPGLKVSARTSAFHFKGKDTPISEIAKQLGVAYVVEGSVRKQGEKVRITAQLIKAADGFHVWSDTFTRDLKDIFAVQDEIAGLIAQQLQLKLGENARAASPINPEAFELYVQARQAWNRRNMEGYTRAEALLNRALTLEPKFARAHAALADVWRSIGEYGDTLGRFDARDSAGMQRILAKAREAVQLDPESAEAHAALGSALWLGWNWTEAERELRRAIALNPNYASAHQWLGRVLGGQGWMTEALAELKLAVEADPLSSRIVDNYAGCLDRAGRYREALAQFDRALVLQPDNVQALTLKGLLLVKMGRPEEGMAIARSLSRAGDFTRFMRMWILYRAGRQTEALEALREFDSTPEAPRTLGIEGPERWLDVMQPGPIFSYYLVELLLIDPYYNPVRQNPRFLKLLATLGLTEAHERAQAWRKAHPPETGGQK